MRQFVPMTDEMLYRAGGPPGPLVPYRFGVPCQRDSSGLPNDASGAMPALDSRTVLAHDAAADATLPCHLAVIPVPSMNANACAEA